jgi:hypothetical protein
MARGRKRGGGIKLQARKKITVKLLEREHSGKVTTPYRIMEELVQEHHHHLVDAKIAIAWRYGKKADADGRLWLGQAKKGSDLDRSLHGYDFVIILNFEAWNSSSFTEDMMRALMDHELTHCAVSNDSNGEPKMDESGKTVYRIRKHDLEEFREVVARHGQWKEDIRAFVEAALRDQREAEDRPLLHPKAAEEKAQADQSDVEPARRPWREIPIADHFGGEILKALTDGGIATLGALADYTAAGKKLTDIEGIGPGRAANIAERMDEFWAKNPHLADEPAASVPISKAATA